MTALSTNPADVASTSTRQSTGRLFARMWRRFVYTRQLRAIAMIPDRQLAAVGLDRRDLVANAREIAGS